MVHRRELNGSPIVLGNQGDLWGNAMTWWDHETGSIWSQPLGEAIAGPLAGTQLELLPSSLTTWEAWKVSYPDTLALDVAGWATGFDLADMSIVVDRGTEAASYLIPALRERGVVNDVVGGWEIAVVIDPDDDQRWAVFSRRIDGGVVELEVRNGELVDIGSGTVFDPFIGRGVSGPLADQTLDRVPGFTAFRTDYVTFFPSGKTWPP
jgi:hypothetical protein